MRHRTTWLSSLGIAAAATFFLDPTSGKRRRRRVGDTVAHVTRQTTRAASTVGRDLRNRTQGMIATARHRLSREQPDDVVVEERVHSALGRVVADPHLITVTVHQGHVILDGPIPPGEKNAITSAVRAVTGVRDVETRFDRHIQPAHDPSSDVVAAAARIAPKPDIFQRSWAPATRAIVAGSGAALVGAGVMRRDRVGVGLAVAGAAMMARAATNLPVRHLVGIGPGRRAIDVQKSMTVDLPVERVFAFWDNPANLPTVMHHVRDVKTTDEPGQWRWTVFGTAGVPIEFVTVVTDRVQDRLLAWKTVEGSVVEHAGIVRFDPLDGRRTRIGLRLSYHPPGGALAHGVLRLLGADPKSRLDEDLVRMKTAFETGHRAHDAARPA